VTTAHDILGQAIPLLDSGNFSGAEKLLSDAIANGLDNKNTYIGLSKAQEAQGRTEAACKTLSAGLQKHPESLAILISLGGALIRTGDSKSAVTALEKAVGLAPDSVGAHQNLAIAYAGVGNVPKAKAEAEIVLAADPTSKIMLQLASQSAMALGDYRRGLSAYDQLSAVKPLTYTAPNPRAGFDPVTGFSRDAPSPRYTELTKQYEIMHSESAGQGDTTFAGLTTFLRVAPFIRERFHHKGMNTLLDYGGGQGKQYALTELQNRKGETFPDMAAFLGVQSAEVYDAGRPGTEISVSGSYNAVICTDVLEHCDAQDLPWIIRELFALANKAVFATIATYPAVKHLPNGENAHCTLESSDWWSRLFVDAATEFPNIDYAYLVVNDKAFEKVEAFAGGPGL
jgi:tetratricopeptide (TPR) repeat protein